MTVAARHGAALAFRTQFGAEPCGVVFAPGRVNLIGEHVDYNDGLVMPMPVRRGTAIAWGHWSGPGIEAFAANLDAQDRFEPGRVGASGAEDWTAYVRGVCTLWPSKTPSLRLAIFGDLPRGSGLSSSASLCIAVARAVSAASGAVGDPMEVARLAQRVEHEFAGVSCGIMDQAAIAAGKPGQAMLLDCRMLDYRSLELPPDWQVAVVQSGVTRGLVDGEYNARRAQCEAARNALGVASLRDATLDQVKHAALEPVTEARVWHVITEIERVNSCVAALNRDDIATFGSCLRESHRSLRDDFEVSVPEVDRLVDKLNAAIGDAGGARMTGAGFGGAVVAVYNRLAVSSLHHACEGKDFDVVN
ncbi:MAG: galactokinase [Pontixanthobacter sp.]